MSGLLYLGLRAGLSFYRAGRYGPGHNFAFSGSSASLLCRLLTNLLVVPVGRGHNDGLTYPVNPRFDGEGRWRKRVDWPEELR